MRTPTRAVLAFAMVGAVVAGAGCLDGSATSAEDKKAKGGKSAKAADSGAGQIVGRVGDRTFTLEEVDRAAMKTNIDIFQKVYDARRQALQSLIDEDLLTRAAAERGVSMDELVEAEIVGKTAAVTDDAIQGFYTQNQARMGGRTLEQVSGQIRDYLQATNGAQARETYLTTLREGAAIEMRIDPPRVEMIVAANDPAKGPATAQVTIVEYSDFQ